MTQPTALRLVEDLQYVVKYSDSEHWDTLAEVAAELRRLHAENEALRNAANRGGHLAVAQRMIDELEDQRDALLEALKYHQEQTRPIQKSIDAIAKAEGNT